MFENSAINRKVEFDIARGLAVTAVVFAHNGGIPLGRSYIEPYYIALFFVISGYFYKPINKYHWKRVKYLGIKYIQYSLALFLINLIKSRSFKLDNIIGILYGRYCLFKYNSSNNIILMNIANHPLWFLPAMIVSTILMGILVSKMKPDKYILVILVALTLVAYALSFLPILLPWSLDTAPILVIFMMFGSFLKKNDIFAYFDRSKRKFILFFSLVPIYILLKMANRGINIAVRLYGGGWRLF